MIKIKDGEVRSEGCYMRTRVRIYRSYVQLCNIPAGGLTHEMHLKCEWTGACFSKRVWMQLQKMQ